MEDLFGVLIFIVFAGLSVVGRFMKNQEQRKGSPPQHWPGPTAQPPGRIPTPVAPQPPRPAQPTFQRAQPAPAPLRPQPPVPVDDPWRSGSLPDLEDPEGPEQSERLSVGMERFARERDAMDRHEIAGAAGFTRESEAFGERRLGDLRGGLAVSEETTAVSETEVGPAPELMRALAHPTSTAQAIMLAQVLGTPRGMRRQRRI